MIYKLGSNSHYLIRPYDHLIAKSLIFTDSTGLYIIKCCIAAEVPTFNNSLYKQVSFNIIRFINNTINALAERKHIAFLRPSGQICLLSLFAWIFQLRSVLQSLLFNLKTRMST
jgi:hypothetical protein